VRLQDYLDISQAQDSATFRRRMIGFAHWMDFPIVGAVLLTELDGDRVGLSGYVGNRPPDFAEASDPHLAKVDPVVAQLCRSNLPFKYDQRYYCDAGAPELWEMASPYGYRTGISVAFRLSDDRQLLVGLDRERNLPTGGRLETLFANLERFAAFTADAVLRFATSDRSDACLPVLTEREREILLRVLEGKSNWAMARLMSISENTVKFHLKNIFRKLDVSSRVVAATRAHSLGLL
jgi:LuxR family transcriptional activator of conjugal transfer of Ti plasmids